MRARADEKSTTDFVPGPGAYTIKEKKAAGKTMQGRYEERDSAPVPGPGAYNTQRKEKGGVPAYSFGIKTKDGTSTMENPGPGQYQVSFVEHRDIFQILFLGILPDTI